MRTHINELRKKQGLTQQELADRVAVTRQTIIALEQGRYNPSLQLAHKVTRAVGKTHIEEVFDLDESGSEPTEVVAGFECVIVPVGRLPDVTVVVEAV